MSKRPPVYLGDGVYLSDDGFQLWLSVGNHSNPALALDTDVFKALCEQGAARFRDMQGAGESGR
jgi:hypothetical protein